MTGTALDQLALDKAATTTGRDHPDTSLDAAYRALGRSGTCRRRILYALRMSPMTDEEMQFHLRMSPNTQRPRRLELVRGGMVVATDERRRGMSGASSIVWQATPLGLAALALPPPDQPALKQPT